jgi:hypothetical protein
MNIKHILYRGRVPGRKKYQGPTKVTMQVSKEPRVGMCYRYGKVVMV